ncbi:MAG: lipid II flippase MurJ [Polyangiaceae bacterium]
MTGGDGARPDPAGQGLLRTTLLVLPFQVIFRVGEGLLPLVLAAWFGRSAATDAYYLASAVFVFVGTLVVLAFQDSALVPVLTEVDHREPAEFPRVAGAIFAHAVAASALLAAFVGMGTMAWFFVRGSAAERELVGPLVLGFGTMLMLSACRSFLVGLAHVRRFFRIHPVASGAGMVATLTLLALAKERFGVVAIPWSLAAGEAVAAVLVAGFLRLQGVVFDPTFTRGPAFVRFVRLVASEVVGSAVTRVNPVVDQGMARIAGVPGGGTILRYVFDVALVPTSLVSASLFPVLVSDLSRARAAGDQKAFVRAVTRSTVGVVLVLTLVSAAMFLFRRPLLEVLFLRGLMDPGAVARMVDVFPYALVGVAPFGALLVLARAHVALQNTAILVPMGVFNAASNAVLNLALVGPLGIEGLALATSLMHTLVAAAFAVLFVRRVRAFGDPKAVL